MEFFEPPASPPPPPRATGRSVGILVGPWCGAPTNALPGVSRLRFVLARAEAVLTVTEVRAYRCGFGFTLGVRGLPGRAERLDDRFIHPAFLRLGLMFPDGRKATNVHDLRHEPQTAAEAREPPQGPGLRMLGGEGSGYEATVGCWVWPLPPSGLLTFACEWPQRSLPLTRVEVDGAEIDDAAGSSRLLWGDEEEWFSAGRVE